MLEKQLTKKLKSLGNLDVRVVESRNEGDGTHGTQLVNAMNNGLADIPRDRLSGIFMITDGQVHDIPKQPKSLGLDVPVHALITGVAR